MICYLIHLKMLYYIISIKNVILRNSYLKSTTQLHIKTPNPNKKSMMNLYSNFFFLLLKINETIPNSDNNSFSVFLKTYMIA